MAVEAQTAVRHAPAASLHRFVGRSWLSPKLNTNDKIEGATAGMDSSLSTVCRVLVCRRRDHEHRSTNNPLYKCTTRCLVPCLLYSPVRGVLGYDSVYNLVSYSVQCRLYIERRGLRRHRTRHCPDCKTQCWAELLLLQPAARSHKDTKLLG